MEAVKQKSRLSGLRQSFILYVLTTFLLVAVLSALVIWSCLSLQNYLLPDSDQVYLTVQSDYPDGSSTSTTVLMSLNDALQEIPRNVPTEYNSEDPSAGEPDVRYSVTSIENSFSALSPRRKLAYRGSQIGMTALPVIFSLAGILLCGLTFYRRKLKTPISLLASASQKIAGQNLDFQISCGSRDEMGMLCDSFEKMRQTLKENYQKLWRMLEERRELQGSVAHDLRNPIAIIQGYAQYLQFHLTKEQINREKVLSAADHIMQTAQRLDRYTESLRTISRLEELEIQPRPVSFSLLSDRMFADLSLLAEKEHLELNWKNAVSEQEVSLDAKILYRILENLIGNAVRFAKKEICVRFSCKSGMLHATVSDDGSGFPDKILNSASRYASIDSDGTHSGMGLAICRVLCRNHGGSLTLRNGEKGGAAVSFTLSV